MPEDLDTMGDSICYAVGWDIQNINGSYGGRAMTELLIVGGTVLTQNAAREVITDGAVCIRDGRIEAVGPRERVESEYAPETVIDATGTAVIPGLINTHTHVSDILLRGSFAEDRGLYDWLLNVKQPGTASMDADEHALAATLYTMEALASGTTTFVENDTEVRWESLTNTQAKLEVYDQIGIRAIYGAGFWDKPADAVPDRFDEFISGAIERDPTVTPLDPDAFLTATDSALDSIASLIERHHDPDNRCSVWPAPVVVERTTSEGLRGAYALAEEHDVMTTTHVAEAELQDSGPMSSVEYLRNVGYLGDRALLGHCVQISERDVRLLAETDTRVAHNAHANMRLATGFAPVVSMRDCGVTVGLGTDNSILSDTVNPLSDARLAASMHKGYHRDPGVISAQEAFDMITCEAARAIRRPDLGSVEVGTRADIAIVDMQHPHLTPAPNPVHALVYGAQGFEVETVICDGTVVRENGEFPLLDRDTASVLAECRDVGAEIVERVGIR